MSKPAGVAAKRQPSPMNRAPQRRHYSSERGGMANTQAEGVMSGAELRSVRELLGFSPTWIARYLNMAEREYVLMERGRSPVYKPVARKLDTLADEARELVDDLVSKFEETLLSGDDPVMYTYETDADYEYAQRKQGIRFDDLKPVRWHHHICARVADEVEVKIVYVPTHEIGKTGQLGRTG